MTGAIVVMIFATALMACMVMVYERLLAEVRAERDEALADADLATELFMAEREVARHRHPSSIPTNVRVLRGIQGGAS